MTCRKLRVSKTTVGSCPDHRVAGAAVLFDAFRHDGHPVIFGARVDFNVHDPQPLVRLQPAWAFFTHVEEKLVNARLADHGVWHHRLVAGHVLPGSYGGDVVPVCGIGLPESGLVHQAGLTLHLSGQADGLEHFHRAYIHAICLTFF